MLVRAFVLRVNVMHGVAVDRLGRKAVLSLARTRNLLRKIGAEVGNFFSAAFSSSPSSPRVTDSSVAYDMS